MILLLSAQHAHIHAPLYTCFHYAFQLNFFRKKQERQTMYQWYTINISESTCATIIAEQFGKECETTFNWWSFQNLLFEKKKRERERERETARDRESHSILTEDSDNENSINLIIFGHPFDFESWNEISPKIMHTIFRASEFLLEQQRFNPWKWYSLYNWEELSHENWVCFEEGLKTVPLKMHILDLICMNHS